MSVWPLLALCLTALGLHVAAALMDFDEPDIIPFVRAVPNAQYVDDVKTGTNCAAFLTNTTFAIKAQILTSSRSLISQQQLEEAVCWQRRSVAHSFFCGFVQSPRWPAGVQLTTVSFNRSYGERNFSSRLASIGFLSMGVDTPTAQVDLLAVQWSGSDGSCTTGMIA
jgi:hypothetical protein